MLEHTKRQVYKWKFLQHALSRYVFNRSLFDIFTQVEMAEEQECKKLLETNKVVRNIKVVKTLPSHLWIE